MDLNVAHEGSGRGRSPDFRVAEGVDDTLPGPVGSGNRAWERGTIGWIPPTRRLVFMPMLEFLNPDSVVSALRVRDKKHVLQELATQAARRLPGLSDRDIFETLLQRERLGSTGIGDGVAIPHGKLAQLDRLFGLVARLEKPVDFDALDGQPVDVAFLLLAPETAGADHLKALAQVARLLREPGMLERIRSARDATALYALLANGPTTQAA